MPVTIRTYESFEIHWSDRARWTGYDTAAEAQRIVDSPGIVDRTGVVVRKTFEVRFTSPALLAIANPGIAERTEEAA